MDDRRKKIVGLIVVITVLLVLYQFNCMLYSSSAVSYYHRKKKLLQMITISALNRSRYRKARKPREYWVASGRTRVWWDNFIHETVLQNEW